MARGMPRPAAGCAAALSLCGADIWCGTMEVERRAFSPRCQLTSWPAPHDEKRARSVQHAYERVFERPNVMANGLAGGVEFGRR